MEGLCKCGCGQPTTIAIRNRKDRGWLKGQPVPYVWGHNPVIPFHQKLLHFWSSGVLFPSSGWPDCIEWAGHVGWGGYGDYSTGILGEEAVHRIAYVLSFGPIPKGLEPDHLCRNRKCFNPFHLELVTRKINSRRGARAKLTMELASELRLSVESERRIAVRLGVHRSTVYAVRSGRTWVD